MTTQKRPMPADGLPVVADPGNSTFATRRAEREAREAVHGVTARRRGYLRAGENADVDIEVSFTKRGGTSVRPLNV